MKVYELERDVVPQQCCLKMRNDGKFLIVESYDLRVYYLNKTAAAIYRSIDGKRSVDGIKDLVLQEYDITAEELEEELLTLLRDMEKQHILRFLEKE